MAERDLGNIGAAEQRFRAGLELQSDLAEARENLADLKKAGK